MTLAHVQIIGGGPAGLMAADVLSAAGVRVTLWEAMPSVGRKFLLAGKGGLNLTHSEALPAFLGRYGHAQPILAHWLARFPPDSVRDFSAGLGVETFVGTSGRVFPSDMKAGPLMRRWVARLRERGVAIRVRHRFIDWDANGTVQLEGPDGLVKSAADATVFALGGASWSKLGSDGHWISAFGSGGIPTVPFDASNCGFECDFSDHLRTRFQGHPLKNLAARVSGQEDWRRGEAMLTADGIEGSLVYALSPPLREVLRHEGSVVLELDLLPDRDHDTLVAELSAPRQGRTRSEHWRRRLALTGAKAALLLEVLPADLRDVPERVARHIKCLPLKLLRTRPMDEAISTTGGISLDAVDARLMLKAKPGYFVAGEMLDWDAPTGGYLLTASMASGVVAAEGVLAWLAEHPSAL